MTEIEQIPLSYEEIEISADWLKERMKIQPLIGIICGSGLGPLTEIMEDTQVFPYHCIPNFPVSTVAGHAGELVFGVLSGVPVVAMKGRFHYFEGYNLRTLATPVRVMKLLGIKILLVTNAAGSLNPEFGIGDIMFIKDHVALPLMLDNSLRGPNDERFGPRFVGLKKCYDPGLLSIARTVSEEFKDLQDFREGVYFLQCGPHYETIAELRMMRNFGVDSIGMSTVPEVMVARHCDIKVFAFSVITNVCNFDYDDAPGVNHEEVLAASKQKEPVLKRFVAKLIEKFKDEL